MRFSGRPPGAPVTTITLITNGKTLDTWPSNVEHPVAVDVTNLLRTHDELHITVHVDDTYSPPRDKRLLGVALVGDAQLSSYPGKKLPSPDAAVSVVLLVLLASLARGRRAGWRGRLIAAGAIACVVTAGVLVARVSFWRIAMPLELALGLLVIVLWAREWWTALTVPIRFVQERTGLGDRVLVIGGAVIALGGQVIVASHHGMLVGAVILIVGLIVLMAGFVPNPTAPFSTLEGGEDNDEVVTESETRFAGLGALAKRETRIATWQIVALVGIAMLAVVLRVALSTEMPSSLFKDEARHALKAARILDDPSYRPVYEPEISLPALFLYPLALAFKLFGVSIATLRGMMALIGAGDVLLFFLLGRRLFGTRVGLIASYLFAVSFWALRAQRIGFAQSFALGLVLIALWLFVRALERGGWVDWALAGVGAAGTVYSYHSGPFALVLMALVALILLVRGARRFARFWLPRCVLFTAIFLIVASPLLRYVVTHFEQYSFRPSQTAIFSEINLTRLGYDQLAAFEANIEPNLGMYTVRGDREAKHNLPFAPHLDAITAIFFLSGLLLVFVGWRHGPPLFRRRFGEWFAVGYLGMMLIPSLLAIDAPNTFRAFDTLAPVIFIAALGAEAMWLRVFAPIVAPAPPLLAGSSVRRAGLGAALATIVLAVVLLLNVGIYFGRMRTDPRVTLRFDTYFATQAGKQMVAEATAHPGMTFFVPRDEFDRDVVPFFARVIANHGTLRPLEDVPPSTSPAQLPKQYAILLPNGKQDTPPDEAIRAAPWATGLERIDGSSPAGAGGVPAFIEYRTPG